MTAAEVITQAEAAKSQGKMLKLAGGDIYWTPDEVVHEIEAGFVWPVLNPLEIAPKPSAEARSMLPPEFYPADDAFDYMARDLIVYGALMLLLGGVALAFGVDTADCFDRLVAGVWR